MLPIKNPVDDDITPPPSQPTVTPTATIPPVVPDHEKAKTWPLVVIGICVIVGLVMLLS